MGFSSLRAQYRFFADRFPHALLFFQVGCFYELYDGQAADTRCSKLVRAGGPAGFSWFFPKLNRLKVIILFDKKMLSILAFTGVCKPARRTLRNARI